MKNIFSNIKLMIHPVWVIITLILTAIMFLITGYVGLFLGPFFIYGIMFHDKNHRWDGKNWVGKDGVVCNKKSPKDPVL